MSEQIHDRPSVLVCVIDAQVDFVMPDGLLSVAGAERIIAPAIAMLTRLDPDEVAEVLMTFDTHEALRFAGSPENLGDPDAGIPGFGLHCEKGTPGWQTVLNPRLIPDAIPCMGLEKDVFDMWEQPAREVLVRPIDEMEGGPTRPVDRASYIDHLRESGVDTVRIFGVASDFCLRLAIRGFVDAGFRVEVVERLTAGIIREIPRVVADEFPDGVTLV